ncbi:phage tail assembly chaperone [Shinella daejeonensis]|uniref:phage tail assembly chaperone n=1 Tax=Shinella daejeonensis TaxID=659017 RepID=UPI003F5CC1D6
MGGGCRRQRQCREHRGSGKKLAEAVRWEVADGEENEQRRRRLEARGKPIPDELWPPDLLPGADAWLSAFWELSTDRQIGFATGPVPSSSIDRYTAGWEPEEASRFRHCIREMDKAFMKAISSDVDLPDSDNPARDAFRARMR